MIDNPFRSILPKYTGSIVRVYKFLRLSPNQITILSLVTSCFAAYCVARNFFIGAALLWWLGRLFDGTDGIYARTHKKTSSFGAFLDILFDMASYSVMILGFYFALPKMAFYWALILLLYVLCITGALALGSLEDKTKVPGRDNRGLRLAAGIAEGGETGIAYTLFLVFPQQIKILASIWIGVLALTIFARIMLAKKELRG